MRGRRKTVIAVVKSNKMDKTVVCEVERLVMHPKYKKYIRKKTKLYAHDPNNECQIGDKVLLMETRPLSKLKRWRVVKKL
ncbi:MAG: 30S ribosomal protein S17 [candidate division WOR-3 bacterium]|nr:30S ribosomal protein S17 [candidate division WOR-3 bacterium]MCX7837638.1 30S ribosomal protein S17 [candidate division WOR-3 bacterium]MDW8114366.1 30S ribosomal protein S17 [candidate division WOR-3 bacterium]